MTTYEYLMLSWKEQKMVLLNKSTFIMRKDGHGVYCDLYAVSLFFVEVEKEMFTDAVLNVSIFVTGNKLDKYVGEIILEY